MGKFLLDANIFLGLLNKNDIHHQRCLAFWQEIDRKHRNGEKIQGIIPLYLAIEVNIKIRKKKRNQEWSSMPPLQIDGPEFYPIDLNFLNRIQEENLYDKFDKLSSADAIYAMIAYLEKIPLITMDRDFEKVKDLINVQFI